MDHQNLIIIGRFVSEADEDEDAEDPSICQLNGSFDSEPECEPVQSITRAQYQIPKKTDMVQVGEMIRDGILAGLGAIKAAEGSTESKKKTR